MKKFLKALSLFLGIALSLNIFLVTFEFLAFNASYYRSEFDTLGVAGIIGVSSEDLHAVSDALVWYIDDGSGDILLQVDLDGQATTFYNAKERHHLEDIRLLVIGFRRFLFAVQILMLFGLLALYYASEKNLHQLIKPLGTAFWTAVVLLVALGTLYWVDFDWAFRRFHEIFFTNDLWLLDPMQDRLIQMMPLDFFIRFTARWLGLAAMVHVAMYGAYRFILWKFKRIQ